MNPIRKTQLILLCLLVLAALANLSLGAVNLSTAQVWDGLFQGSEHYFTIHDYRLPRVWIALLVGAMLATAGVLIQGVIRNPLASPDILGVSHGAGLAAVALMTPVADPLRLLVTGSGAGRRVGLGGGAGAGVRWPNRAGQTGDYRCSAGGVVRQCD